MEFLQRFGPSDVANASGSMPFRLLSASPARCGAVTRSGKQCAINAGSSLRDGSGKLVSEPLRHGGPHCMFHMSLFESLYIYPLMSTSTPQSHHFALSTDLGMLG